MAAEIFADDLQCSACHARLYPHTDTGPCGNEAGLRWYTKGIGAGFTICEGCLYKKRAVLPVPFNSIGDWPSLRGSYLRGSFGAK